MSAQPTVCALLFGLFGLFGASACVDSPLSNAELDKRIDAESKAFPTALLVADCLADKCADNANDCHVGCFEQASEGAKPLATKLWECWKTECHLDACARAGDASCMSQCLVQRCGDAVVQVLQTDATGVKTCSDAIDCIEACDASKPGLFTCMGACLASTTPIGKDALNTFAACAGAADGDIKKVCHDELVACYSDTAISTGECHVVAPCIDRCAAQSKGNTCIIKCRDKLSTDGQAKFDPLMTCIENKGFEKCGDKALACVDPAGERSCIDTYACASLCRSVVTADWDGIGCLYSCMHNATPGEADALGKLSACDKGGDQTVCGDGLKTCAAAAGALKCPEVTPCVTKCYSELSVEQTENNEFAAVSCTLQCLNQATVPAAAAYVDYILCFEACKNDKGCDGKPGCNLQCNAVCKKEQQACGAN